jgi:hypothetical protein
MEPSGRNWWQPVANGGSRERLRQAKSVAVGCDPLPESLVRRRSTVRVRQRACIKALQIGMWRCLRGRIVDVPRVRDGYILGLAGKRGHARRLATQPERAQVTQLRRLTPKSPCKQAIGVCCAGSNRTPSFAREGVDGSSPSESSHRSPAKAGFLSSREATRLAARVRNRYAKCVRTYG